MLAGCVIFASYTILDNSVSPVSASGTTPPQWSNSLFPRALAGVLCCELSAPRVPPVHQVATTGRAYLTMCKLIHQWADPFWNRGTHLSKSLHFLWRKIKEQKGVLCTTRTALMLSSRGCWNLVFHYFFTAFFCKINTNCSKGRSNKIQVKLVPKTDMQVMQVFGEGRETF